MVCLGVLFVAGATTTTINSPANASYDTDGDLTINYSVTGNASTWTCHLYKDGSEVYTDSGVSNNTYTYYSGSAVTDLSDGTYYFNITCHSTTAGIDDTGDAFTDTYVYVDSVAPVITVEVNGDDGSDEQWLTAGTLTIGATVVDNNADSCILYTTINTTANATQAYGAYPTGSQTYTNATAFNFTGYDTGNLGMDDNNTGAYIYNVYCNDSAGNTYQTSNYTIWVDSVSPTAFAFNTSLFKTTHGVSFANASYCTDYYPQFGWNRSIDNNFAYYSLRAYNGSSYVYSDNITRSATLAANFTNALRADQTETIIITAYDLAGNSQAVTTNYVYYPDSTSHTLYSGWNIVMNSGNAMTLTNALTYSGSTIASWFNTSSNSFVSYVSGGTGGSTSVPYGEAIFLYMESAGTFDDFVVNTSAGTQGNFNITNQTASDWNIACQRNTSDSFTFTNLDYYLNGNKTDILSMNVTYFSFYNNSASTGSKYIPYVANWTTSTASTPLSYGDCVWLFLNDAVHVPGYLEINWLSIT